MSDQDVKFSENDLFWSIIIMFQSKITLEEYLKSVQHEEAAGTNVSLDDIDMIPNLEEEDGETVEENIFKSKVSTNMNSSLITIPDNFKDDKEGDDYEQNQRSNRLLASEEVTHSLAPTPRLGKKNDACIKDSGQLENSTALRDEGGVAPASRSFML
ncbi:hypothetical protein Cgig2_027378 [Carnegiea gigantea]|uniref:Uncharacterized protein n=1 Tax=Carnegiea gigantea TaxID=171969 RepID=A0A9Q1GPG0_9CARY|nr:hypothetical protein Cgig2_027378 [Carnegiea gigantea]